MQIDDNAPSYDIEPNIEAQLGEVYSLSHITNLQPKTVKGTSDMVSAYFPDWMGFFEDSRWEYTKVSVEDLINDSQFSSSLRYLMRVYRQHFKTDPHGDYWADREIVKAEIEAIADGKQSTVSKDVYADVAWSLSKLLDGDTYRLRETVDKISDDFNRVSNIAKLISDTSSYYPPTVEDIQSEHRCGFTTFDGAHRIVALSEIVGDTDIHAWELANQSEILEKYECTYTRPC